MSYIIKIILSLERVSHHTGGVASVEHVRFCFTSLILPSKSKTLSKLLNFRIRSHFSNKNIHKCQQVGGIVPRQQKKNHHKTARYSYPMFVLNPHDKKMLQCPNFHSPFFRTLPSILSEVLYHPPFPITSRIGASQSNLCQVYIGRTNQNTPFNYPITSTSSLLDQDSEYALFLTLPSRPCPWCRKKTWRGFVLVPHSCPHTTLVICNALLFIYYL